MIVRLISLYIVVLYIYNTVRINVVYQPIVRKTTLTRTTPPQKPDLLPILKPDPPQKPRKHRTKKPVLIMNNNRMSDKIIYSDKYFPPYTPHKLDFTCGDITCDYFKAIHRLQRPISGEQYKPDFDVLFNVIKLHQKGHIIPMDSDIVMHLRLGDVANSKCWEGIGCHFEFSKKCYEHMHIHPPPGHIVVVSSNKHLAGKNAHRESDEYKNKVVNFLRNKGYSVTDRHDHTEEEDVIFMFNAKQFIPGGGGFSDLVKQMAKKNGAKIIEDWKGHCNDPPQKPIVHILNTNNGVGLGQVVQSMVPVLYTLRNEDYTHFNIHECGLNPPWRNAVSCEIRPKYVALFNNFKRTRGRNDYTKLKDTNQMEYFDGQKNWYKFLTSPSKPNTKMILIENVHNRWRPHGFNDCDEIKYWFDEPVGHLLKLVQEPAQKIQTTITFHIRTFADERIGIAFNEDLTLNETLAKLERNYEKENEQRIQRVINMQTQFPNMIQKLVDIADFIYEKTGKITHVAADSEVVRKCLRKYPFIHIITPGVLDYNKHFKTEPNYSLSEISDWYLLSLGKKIAVFPSGSTFSGVAQCRGGGKTTYPHKTEDMDVIFDNIKRRFQKNIELHVLEKDADFGAGFYMEGAAKIYEIADAAGIPSTSIHSCGTRNKPWHVTAMRCPKNHWHSAKRIKEMFKTLGPYQEIDDSKDFVHIDGQKQDWVKALQDLNPAKPTKVFLTEPHNKFIAFRYHYENRNCKGKKKWFGESIFEFPANIQNKVSFHLRFLTHEDYGVQISKNLSIHKVHRSNTLYDSRMDNQEVNIPDVKQSVDIILQYADSMFKKTGKATFIATDSDNVRKYTRQYPYISTYNISHDIRELNKIHFSKASTRDLYTLAQAKHIITFPFKSQFSATAACLGDGKQVVVHTLDKLKQELSKHMNELEKSAVKIEKKTRKDLKTRATDAEKKMVGNEKVVNDVLLNSLGGVGSSNFIKEIEKTTVKSNDHADNDGFKHRNSDYFLWTSDGIYGLNRQGVLTKFNKIIIIIGKPIHSILSVYKRFKYKHINKWRRNVHRRWFKQDLDISKIWNMTLAAQSDVLGIQEYLQSWLVKCKEYRSICQVVDTETLYNHADYYAKYAGVKNVARFKAMSYQPTSTRLTDENIPSGVLHIYKTLYATAYEDMQHHIRKASYVLGTHTI